MKVLLSIKPEYVYRILLREKKYEYRKKIWKREDIEEVVIYSSYPVKKVVGTFVIEKILEGNPQEIWNQTKEHSGISKEKYDRYFKETDKAYAIYIPEFRPYKEPMTLGELWHKVYGAPLKEVKAPQNFMYLKEVKGKWD